MSVPELYRHRQPGRLIWICMGLAALMCIVLALLLPAPRPSRVMLSVLSGLFVALAWLFGSLTTVVREGVVEIHFGPGLISKRFPLGDFVSVVRNKWYYGWGIRIIRKGWLYNVSGLDAVELVRKNGRVLRIGTDEPDALAQALREAMAGAEKKGSGTFCL